MIRPIFFAPLLLMAAACSNEAASPDSVQQTKATASEKTPDFRAIGQEPGWIMRLYDQDRVHLEYDYASKTASVPFTENLKKGEALKYGAQTQEDTLSFRITNKPCTDPMNGRQYDQSVEVTINGQTLQGCGEWL